MLINLLHNIFSLITIELFFLSAVLFISGLSLSIYVAKKEMKWLCWYPEWIWERLKNFVEKQPGFSKIFLLIFIVNSSSLFFNLISGFGIVLPVVFAVLTGMNVGIIAYKEGGIRALISMCVTPNAIFELPAAWLSIALAIRLGLEMISPNAKIGFIVSQSLFIYLRVILPLLLIAALLEAGLTYFSIKKLQHTASFPNEPFNA
ncbi:MAG: stage II sporulation protein M [bacterium]|nr:MAG: stage II sporulation protein M [bacterium]